MTPDAALAEIHNMLAADESARVAALEAAFPIPSADDTLLGILEINGPDCAQEYIDTLGRSAFSPGAIARVRSAAQ